MDCCSFGVTVVNPLSEQALEEALQGSAVRGAETWTALLAAQTPRISLSSITHTLSYPRGRTRSFVPLCHGSQFKVVYFECQDQAHTDWINKDDIHLCFEGCYNNQKADHRGGPKDLHVLRGSFSKPLMI